MSILGAKIAFCKCGWFEGCIVESKGGFESLFSVRLSYCETPWYYWAGIVCAVLCIFYMLSQCSPGANKTRVAALAPAAQRAPVAQPATPVMAMAAAVPVQPQASGCFGSGHATIV